MANSGIGIGTAIVVWGSALAIAHGTEITAEGPGTIEAANVVVVGV